ncbi:nli interacting factor-like phosphatase family protein [Stylonychia lemnae]|uniref:Nli interacting factor-like phosphatase family protein n=1 Tax=Stylonychia lemnae TaxID=5949 RepID=A0A078ASI1_STYLE|nr:nli interacting factor-like phosphatase family protein [Stylonychia lemnae]|eukprot:CDW84172.1 nli interacting factor-like phosphatase family protein [Stylonychia lemnae]
MIKYEKNKSPQNQNVNSLIPKKTHLERKAQSQNKKINIDLSKRTPDNSKKQQKQKSQLEVSENKKVNEGCSFDESLMKSPISTARDQDASQNQTTLKKSISPGILSGRLTIKSINNIQQNIIDEDFSSDTKRSEFKAELIQHQEERQEEVGSVIIVNHHQHSHTPYIPSPNKNNQREDDQNLLSESDEKLRAPQPHKDNRRAYQSNKQQQFKSIEHRNQESIGGQSGTGSQYYEQQNDKIISNKRKYLDLVTKGTAINKERDSLILKEKKEKDISSSLIDSHKEIIYISNTYFEKEEENMNGVAQEDQYLPSQPPPFSKMSSSLSCDAQNEDVDECPPISPNQDKTSFVSRASIKLSKGFSSNSSSVTNRKSQCSHRCSRGGFKTLFNCCTQNNGTGRNKNDNNSDYSNGSAFNKVLINNKNGGSFVLRKSLSGSNLRAEDFTDDVDEYENDSYNHRLSIVKRKNVNQSKISQPGIKIREQSNIVSISSHFEEAQAQKKQQKLDKFVTKMPLNSQIQANNQSQRNNQDIAGIYVNLNSSSQTTQQQNYQTTSYAAGQKNVNNDDSATNSSGVMPQDIHRLHFLQTIQALHTIKNVLTITPENEIEHLKINLPPPNHPSKKKTLIFDMDETLIHCVDDIENEDPDVIIPIDFPDEDELVNAGVNIRPYLYECLEEANKLFQVIVFTASHKAYADAILDYIDPENKYFQYRLYRENCVQTKEGYYIKDLRILNNRDLRDVVIIDNSVFSFSFHIDNGIPIIPFYADKEDEEMLHLIYYLNCLTSVEDVRVQNQEAFELRKLQLQSPLEIINNYYTTNNQQQLLLQHNTENYDDRDIIMEENEDTQEVLSEDEIGYNDRQINYDSDLIEHQDIIKEQFKQKDQSFAFQTPRSLLDQQQQ